MLINKPYGIVVHPGFGNETGTLINGIKYYQKENPLNIYRGGIVHRLDKNTSGLLIVAKNKYSQKHLLKQFYKRKIYKEYIALVWGKLYNKNGKIEGFIKRDPKNGKKMINSILSNNKGRYSITYYKVLEEFNSYLTYISCKSKTGRTHQIRVHFKYIGHPLFNDSTYGGNIIKIKKLSDKNKKFFKMCFNVLSRQALHAISISFIHPNKYKYSFSCPIPNDINKMLQICRSRFIKS